MRNLRIRALKIFSARGTHPSSAAFVTPRDLTRGRVTEMTTTDYDAPRRSVVELEEDSLEELKSRRTAAQSPVLDVDDAEAAEGFELPGADLSGEELTVSVVPMQADEFRCSRCFLVHHRSQRVGGREGPDVCRECA